jgi:hypothetical protein
MKILSILQSKPHNPHYLNRYYKFIRLCQEKSVTVDVEAHHICPKAKDLFPEYTNGVAHPWNIAHLTYRQHLLAHWMLWKAYQGSQVYAFVGMCQQKSKRGNVSLKSSRAYEAAKKQANKMLKHQNKGFAIYVDKHGAKVRCQTDDPRVLLGELTSTSKGRKYAKRDQASRDRTRAALTGMKLGPMPIEKRIARRVRNDHNTMYFDPTTQEFVELDPLLAPTEFIKVFGEGRQVWCAKGKYRRVSLDLPIAPPGWSFVNPRIIYKIINLDTNEYQECTGDLLPPNYHKMSLCKNGKQTLYCITLKKNICIGRDTVSKYGIPTNCSTDTPIRRRRV